jgi:hypothetical protein
MRPVEDALRGLGSEHTPPPGWQQRVLDEIDSRPTLSGYFLWGVIVASVAAVVVMVIAWWA